MEKNADLFSSPRLGPRELLSFSQFIIPSLFLLSLESITPSSMLSNHKLCPQQKSLLF